MTKGETTNPARNKRRPEKRIQSTHKKNSPKKPKDYSFMIAELIPAWTADAIHLRMLTERNPLWKPRPQSESRPSVGLLSV